MSKETIEIEDLGNHGFLTVKGEDPKTGKLRCLGYLMDFGADGVYDAGYGKVDVTPAAAKRHNELFDAANVKALKETAEVGQGGFLYPTRKDGKVVVQTWFGTELAVLPDWKVGPMQFALEGRTYRCSRPKLGEDSFFRRIG